MNTSTDQTPEQSHLCFQMWDKHLTTLNTIWNLATDEAKKTTPTYFHTTLWNQHLSSLNQTWHVSSMLHLQPPSSLLGKLLFPAKKLILRWIQPAIDALIQQQNDVNAQLIQTCNSLVELTNQEAIRKIDAQTEVNAKFVQCLNTLVDLTSSELERLRGEVYHHLDTFQTQFATFQTHLAMFQTHLDTLQNHIQNRLEQIEPRFAEIELILWAYDRRKEALEFEQIALNQKLEQILTTIRSLKRGEIPGGEHLPSPERQKDYSYFVFENRHRGDEKTIKLRLTDYVRYFKGCSNVLDIGCARGEFLELLAEHQIQGYGIDLNHSFVQYCQHKGLHVQETDAISHLRDLPDNSIGGIFIAHLIEHFSMVDLQKLLQLCFEKLAPHQYLVLETPNPCSVYALSQYFYKDLSHDKPLHPEAILFLTKSVGFQQADIVYKNPFPAKEALQLLEPLETADTLLRTMIDVSNRNFQQLNTLLYGHLDYAIIARKRPVV